MGTSANMVVIAREQIMGVCTCAPPRPLPGHDLADAGGRRHFHLNHFVFLDLRLVLLPGAYLAEAGIRVPLL